MGISSPKSAGYTQLQSESSMSSNTLSRGNSALNNQHIDQFSLIWLDEKSHHSSLDSLRTKMLLLEINNNDCLFFDDTDKFLLEIQRIKNKNRKLLVVMSGSFAKQILSSVNDIPTIIIFCKNNNQYIDLKNVSSNIVDICSEHETLKSCIYNELLSLKFNLFDHQELKSIRPLSSSKSVYHSGAYSSYLLFIETLKQMPQTKQARDIMLNKCKDYHRKNEKQISNINLFERTYNPNEAIRWYAKETFLYRLVNRAFRTEDVELWYIFRSYIIDLCRQLENVHKEQNIQVPLKLYRGQSFMPIKEFEYLQSNIGCLISTNGFFSTSRDRTVAEGFLGGAKDTDNFKVVIFEITVDGVNLQNTVFVDIQKHSVPQERKDEKEVLFNIGSVFKVLSVTYDSKLGVPIIEMKATDEGTSEIKEQIEAKRKQLHNGNINLMFGHLLITMNEDAKAEAYFRMLLKDLPRTDNDLPSVYDYVGELNMRTTNWNEALKNFELAYGMKRKKRWGWNHIDIERTLNNIGNYYKAIGDHLQAYQYYTNALECTSNPTYMTIIQLNISSIYEVNKDYEQALNLCFEVRDNLQQIDPYAYAQMIHCQGKIGQIYFSQKNYVIAEEYYFTAFEMSQRFLVPGDRLRTCCIEALADLYNEQGWKQKAIDLCLEALCVYERDLPENHPGIGHLLMKIGESYDDNDDRKIDSLQRALFILEKNVHLDYITTANCLLMIGTYFQKHKKNMEAVEYYLRAHEIRTKIYPENHTKIWEIQWLIDAVNQSETD